MNIKHNEIEISDENPFANCKLGRQKYAHILTNIIDSYSYGFVLAINNKWGTGKTTFVKMWRQELVNKEYQTVYFNAWENDFENNPLTALMGELKTLTTESTEPEFKSTLNKAAILTKHIAPIVAKAIADRYIDTEGIQDAIIGVTKGLTDIFEKEVNDYAKKKKSITDFQNSLAEFIANTNEGKPLIFIIDELDRCRPNYAVSILEQIKHFFSVPNIVFILSIDKTQLGNAVKGVYGSDNIDADEYLRRFIDLEYSIPDPEADIFYKYLYEYFGFDEFFQSDERRKYSKLTSDRGDFLSICKLLFTGKKIPLRQQEKIFALSRLSLRSFDANSYVVPHIFLFLTFTKIIHSSFYDNLKNKLLTIAQMQKEFLSIVEFSKNGQTERELIRLEVYLVNFYHNYLESQNYEKKLYEWDTETGKNKLLIDSTIDKDSNNVFLNILEYIHKGNEGDLDLGYFTNRIELLEDIKL
ncbi:KAP family P-loop NTPase fold protein [Catalinimonas niigatensis]|uniref:KAP family P-loop NTPase fold protein n=1 Tax=Catalinimonas niigatensis TaxID=1397264 RepID=UPI0026662661|nr:P-loop NTPase fold protein [Catalinimonas niigatensis]WPP49250.1 P-loop NTPase fold protein [Catalinimonas niigatensis]